MTEIIKKGGSKSQVIFLGLGSNKGARYQQLCEAITKINSHPEIKLLECSNVYETAAFEFDGDEFLNLVIAVSCTLSPISLLNYTQSIEKQLGRERDHSGERNKNYQSRAIDIDLLYFGNIQFSHTRLTIPHPEINTRLFVTKPLLDLKYLLPSSRVILEETLIVLSDHQKIKQVRSSLQLLQKLKGAKPLQ